MKKRDSISPQSQEKFVKSMIQVEEEEYRLVELQEEAQEEEDYCNNNKTTMFPSSSSASSASSLHLSSGLLGKEKDKDTLMNTCNNHKLFNNNENKDKDNTCDNKIVEVEVDYSEVLPFSEWLEGDSLAPPCPTSYSCLDGIVKLAKIHENDFVLDLGCGDGRVVVGLSLRTHCQGTGIDIEPKCIQKFNERIERWKLGDRVQAVEGDILDESVYEDLLKKATVIYLYLLPEGLQEAVTLMNKLEERMRDGSRIVMNTWTPKSWTRDKEKTWKDNNTSLYLFDKSSLIKEKTEL